MTRCADCTKPARMLWGQQNIPLCIDCALKYQQFAAMQIAEEERAINFLLDEVDAIGGIPLGGPRFPDRKPVQIQSANFHNFSIKNSTIRSCRIRGTLHQVDTAVTVIGAQGDKEAAAAIKALTEIVVEKLDTAGIKEGLRY